MLNSPAFLLLGVGLALAVTVNLSKVASVAGLPAPLFAFGLSLGSGLVLAAVSLARGGRIPADRRHLVYYAVTGFVSVAAPNYLGFEVARHAGAAYASVPYALSPLITYALAVMVGLDSPAWRRVVGVALGLAGTTAIALSKMLGVNAAAPIWYVAALGLPLLVATGNVYRTLRWPAGTAPLALAAGMSLAGALWLAPVALTRTDGLAALATPFGGGVMALQVLVSVLMNWLYFRLQQAAGPVYLSQIGYVAAGLGVALALVLFGEPVTPAMLAGMALVVAGVVLVTPRRTA